MSGKSAVNRHSLTGSILAQGLRAVVFHPNDNDGAALIGHLKRIGFHVQAFWPPLDALPDQTDLVFRALPADEREPRDNWMGPDAPPLICVLAYENPTFIDQSLKMGAMAVVTAPVRASGLLSTIVFALQHARQADRQRKRIALLERKVDGMRHVHEAKHVLIRMHGLSEDDAYDMLRTQAMAKRVSIEDICRSILQANDVLRAAACLARKTGGE
jgi:AmiR/NasT family two-component response regulator